MGIGQENKTSAGELVSSRLYHPVKQGIKNVGNNISVAIHTAQVYEGRDIEVQVNI